MRLIDADAVAARLPPLTLVEALRAGHAEGERSLVERLLVTEGANAALTWAGWHPGRGLAIKTATAFPANAQRAHLPVVQTVVVMFDADDGSPRAAIHGASFTRAKTASDSALGVDLLARADVRTLAVLGAGGQAETHVRYMRAVRPSLTRIALWNRTAAAAEALAQTLAAEGLSVSVATTVEGAVREADVVCCLTGSSAPVLQGRWLAPGTHVDLVGGYTPAMRESDDETVRRGRLFADLRRFALDCGDYAQPLSDGVIGPDDLRGDLYDLCSGNVRGRIDADTITVFKNAGGGHLDLMVACAFLDAAPA